jgi:peptidyl-Lys metalloendopeptidase
MRQKRFLPWLVGSSLVLAACGSDVRDETDESGATSATTLGELEITLAAPEPFSAADEPVSVNITISNPTDHEVRVLRRDVLVDGIDQPTLGVDLDGAPVDYMGRIVNWGEPDADSYLVLSAGESTSHTVDIATGYDLSVDGDYQVSFAGDGPAAVVQLYAEGRKFIIPSSEVPTTYDVDPSDGVGRVAQALLTGCNQAQTDQIRRSWGSARDLMTDVNGFFAQPAANGPRYNTWFGWANDYRWGVISSRYADITAALDYRDVDCTCTRNIYAYVYPSSPYKIYVCNYFWSAPQNGAADSQAGTFIHELSHFYGTGDYAYGQGACQTLAASDPITARANADNYEYFAENPSYLGY